jgi:3-dehydroquinate dehydratase II
MKKILVIHGPNLHLLGQRERQHYGVHTLPQINEMLEAEAASLQVKLETFQSNAEHAIIDKIVATDAQFLLINAAAYTHTSVAIRDTLLAVALPFIEVHLSNIYNREPFRQQSLLHDIATGVVFGLGAQSYTLALIGAARSIKMTPQD